MLDYEELRRASALAEERETAPEIEKSYRPGLGAITPTQRFALALMLFLNVLVLGFLCLLATNRVALPF
jgi:hypothetical protein